MNKRITILGMGPTSSDRAADIEHYVKDTEVWSLNNAYNKFPQVKPDRFFELHTWEYLKDWTAGNYTDGSPVDHWSKLDDLGCPVYVSQSIPQVRNQVEYPFLEVFRHFGAQSVYWLGTPGLMLALALYEHDMGQAIDEIRSFGIDTSDGRHAQQRTSWAWWLSKADERGIKLTGTALNFQGEYDNDAGLVGIRELVKDKIPPEPPPDKLTVVTGATPEYSDCMKRLKKQCDDKGMECHCWNIEPGEDNHRRHFETHKIDYIRQTLEATGNTVFWIDADDEILAPFGVPTSGWDIGITENPEKKITNTLLPYGAYIAVNPSEKGYEFLNQWQKLIDAGNNDHRALNIAIMQASEGLKLAHLSPFLKGAIRVNASRDRTQSTIT